MTAKTPPRFTPSASEIDDAKANRLRRSQAEHVHKCKQRMHTWLHAACMCAFQDFAVCPECVGRVARMRTIYV